MIGGKVISTGTAMIKSLRVCFSFDFISQHLSSRHCARQDKQRNAMIISTFHVSQVMNGVNTPVSITILNAEPHETHKLAKELLFHCGWILRCLFAHFFRSIMEMIPYPWILLGGILCGTSTILLWITCLSFCQQLMWNLCTTGLPIFPILIILLVITHMMTVGNAFYPQLCTLTEE